MRDEYLFVTFTTKFPVRGPFTTKFPVRGPFTTKFPVRGPFTRVILTTPRPIHSGWQTDYCISTALYTDALFDDAFRNSEYKASNVSMITEQGIEKDM